LLLLLLLLILVIAAAEQIHLATASTWQAAVSKQDMLLYAAA